MALYKGYSTVVYNFFQSSAANKLLCLVVTAIDAASLDIYSIKILVFNEQKQHYGQTSVLDFLSH